MKEAFDVNMNKGNDKITNNAKCWLYVLGLMQTENVPTTVLRAVRLEGRCVVYDWTS